MTYPIRVPQLQSWEESMKHAFGGYRVVCGCERREAMHPVPLSEPIPDLVMLSNQLWRSILDGGDKISEIRVWSGTCPNCGQEYQDWAWRYLP